MRETVDLSFVSKVKAIGLYFALIAITLTLPANSVLSTGYQYWYFWVLVGFAFLLSGLTWRITGRQVAYITPALLISLVVIAFGFSIVLVGGYARIWLKFSGYAAITLLVLIFIYVVMPLFNQGHPY